MRGATLRTKVKKCPGYVEVPPAPAEHCSGERIFSLLLTSLTRKDGTDTHNKAETRGANIVISKASSEVEKT